MSRLTHGLQRFVDAERGPVISLSSTLHPGLPGGGLWHSSAELDRGLVVKAPRLFVCRYSGFGWSRDRQESRRKAVVEALERWAYNHYSETAPERAGVDINDSANGFAAMPSDMGPGRAALNAYCEALERWVLNKLWDGGEVYFEPVKGPPGRGARAFFYGLRIAPDKIAPSVPALLHFRLCLLRTPSGGVVAGAACSPSPADALRRAAQEAYIHRVAAARKAAGEAGAQNLVEERLVRFAAMPGGFDLVAGSLRTGRLLHSPPAPLFCRRLTGPWEPEVEVYRVLLADSKAGTDGLCTGRCYY